MEIYNCIAVDLLYYQIYEKKIKIEVYDEEEKIRILTEIDGVEFSSAGEDYFEVFKKLRDQILELGYGLKCNGSRINAIQSNMMAGSDRVYLVEMGKPALMKDVVCMWDYADIDFFPDTEHQKMFLDQWLNS